MALRSHDTAFRFLLLPPLILVLLGVGVVTHAIGWPAVWPELVRGWALALIATLLLLPALFLDPGAGPSVTHKSAAILGAGILFLFSTTALFLPSVGPFQALQWNWQGKLIDLLWMLTLIALLPKANRREIGWTLRTRPGSLSVALPNILIWLAIGFGIARMGMFGDPHALAETDLTLERLLFDATYPNLTEEILFRGLMLAILDRVFRPKWRIVGARIGRGVVLTAWLFGLLHGLSLSPEGALNIDWLWLLQSFVMGLALGWVRALTGSLWPAFLGHCAPELGILLALATL